MKYIFRRLANVTPEDNTASEIEVKPVGGKKSILWFGPSGRLVGQAILENKALADYISRRLANVTPEEDAAGELDIKLEGGKTLILRFGPRSRLPGEQTHRQTPYS